MGKIAIYGAGGFGKETYALLKTLINAENIIGDFIGYFDDSNNQMMTQFTYLGDFKSINSFKEEVQLIIAVGMSDKRIAMRNAISNSNVKFPKIISHRAIISDPLTVTVGEGSIICAGANLTTDITIGKHVVININATIGHDVKLGDFASIMPSVNVSGNVTIGNGTFIGTGATILQGLSIGENVMVGAGAVVTKDIPSGSTVIGIPARIVNNAK